MKRFAAIVHIAVEEPGDGKPVERVAVIDALKRCLRVEMDTEDGGDPAPVTGVTVDANSVAYVGDGNPVVYLP